MYKNIEDLENEYNIMFLAYRHDFINGEYSTEHFKRIIFNLDQQFQKELEQFSR